MRSAVLVLLLTSVATAWSAEATSHDGDQPSTDGTAVRADRPAFKGIELYSWRDDTGVLRFNLLIGTNRNKSHDESRGPDAVPIDLAGLDAHVGALAVGEQVCWTHIDGRAGPTPQEEREVLAMARRHQVVVAGHGGDAP